MNNSLCQYLDWDSEFFGYRIARVTVNSLDLATMQNITAWCTDHAVDCLYFLADSDHTETVQVAEENSFHLVDIRISLVKCISVGPESDTNIADSVIRLSTNDDLPFLRAIAKKNYQDSRFYYDPNIPTFRCEAFYETWIEKSCHGYADVVLVAAFQGKPVGYISCHVLERSQGKIGLVGVDGAIQGKGIGKSMIMTSLQWFAEHNISCIRVATQGRNTKAQQLYQSCGFRTQAVQLWYHKWFIVTQ